MEDPRTAATRERFLGITNALFSPKRCPYLCSQIRKKKIAGVTLQFFLAKDTQFDYYHGYYCHNAYSIATNFQCR
jgi:hypothetical protein